MDYNKAIWLIDRNKTYNIIGDGYDGIVFDGDPIDETDLIAAYQSYLNTTKKTEIKALILEKSEQEKAKYITPTPAKIFAYEQKRRETEAYTAGERDTANLPIMNATAVELDTDLATIHAEWFVKTEAWKLVGAMVEAKYDKQNKLLESAVFENDNDVTNFIAAIDVAYIEEA